MDVKCCYSSCWKRNLETLAAVLEYSEVVNLTPARNSGSWTPTSTEYTGYLMTMVTQLVWFLAKHRMTLVTLVGTHQVEKTSSVEDEQVKTCWYLYPFRWPSISWCEKDDDNKIFQDKRCANHLRKFEVKACEGTIAWMPLQLQKFGQHPGTPNKIGDPERGSEADTHGSNTNCQDPMTFPAKPRSNPNLGCINIKLFRWGKWNVKLSNKESFEAFPILLNKLIPPAIYNQIHKIQNGMDPQPGGFWHLLAGVFCASCKVWIPRVSTFGFHHAKRRHWTSTTEVCEIHPPGPNWILSCQGVQNWNRKLIW